MRGLAPATIRTTLVVLIGIVAAPLVALRAWGIVRSYRDHRQTEIGSSVELARTVAGRFEAFVVDLLSVEHAVGAMADSRPPSQIERDLRVVAAEFPAIRDLSWLSRDGSVVASTEPRLVGKSFFARGYFQAIARGDAWNVSPLVESVLDEAPVFLVARRVAGPSGELRAVLVAAIDPTRLSQALAWRTGGGVTAVVDSLGTVVAIAPDRPLDWIARRRTVGHPWVARALAGEEVQGVFASALDGSTRVGAAVPIASLGWAVQASRPVAETLARARRNALQDALAGAVVAGAALLAAGILARRIGEPLRALEQHAVDLAHGIDSPLRVRGPVEVLRVARACQTMSAGLVSRRAELEAANRAEREATERAEARGAELDAVVAALPIGLVVLDPEGDAVRVNRQALQLLGRDRDRAGRPWIDAPRLADRDGRPFTPQDHPAARALGGARVDGEIVRVERPDGRLAWIALCAAPIEGPGDRRYGAVVTLLDVTDVRGLEEERDTLVHTVSHDLRTPLSVIVGHAELLRRRGGEEERRRAEALLSSAGRMQRLIADLVDAARLETGRVQLRVEPIELGEFLARWRETVAGALDVGRVRLSAGAVPVVLADPMRLEEILANLVSNALKYSAEGSPVDVVLSPERDALRLSVRDRGVGIAPADLPRVFDRYWRAKGTRREGLGLGLFITRKLVEAHGWRIEVESEPGQGSVFTLVIPLSRARGSPAGSAAA